MQGKAIQHHLRPAIAQVLQYPTQPHIQVNIMATQFQNRLAQAGANEAAQAQQMREGMRVNRMPQQTQMEPLRQRLGLAPGPQQAQPRTTPP